MVQTLQLRLLNRTEPAHIHLIGVAGSGMSGLALMLLEMGHKVSGSDKVTSRETERLQTLGLKFSSPQTAEAVADADIVIYSSAIRADNPALHAARQLGIPCMLRAHCLAAILNNKQGVVVAGTHGKTTTSAMCSHILREGRQRPSHYVGAEIPVLGANAHWNEHSPWLIAEGDESDGTLVHYLPTHSIVLNIEAEHLDHYSGLDEIKQVFARLGNQTSGNIIYCAADAGASSVFADKPNAISYGWTDADYTVSEVQEMRGRSFFNICKDGKVLGPVELGIPGRHNVLNALAASVLALQVGVSFESISRALASFAGAKRRFETKYLSDNFRLVDDYGHHPTEIAATLQTARTFRPKRVVVIFQPHRYTRTQKLAAEFGAALQAADAVFVTDIYPASELPIPGISGQTIVDAMRKAGPVDAHFFEDLTQARLACGNYVRPGDLVLTLGAGNVHELGVELARDFAVYDELQRLLGDKDKLALYEPMSNHTTLKVGGPAQYWIEPSSFASCAAVVDFLRNRGLAITFVGRGSNMLVRDGGLRGAVICPTQGEFAQIVHHGNTIVCGSGVKCKKLANVAQTAHLGGFAWFDGIPGNVGGALRMNAGAMGHEACDLLLSVKLLMQDGSIVDVERDKIAASYRDVPLFASNYVLSAEFGSKLVSKEELHAELDASRIKRKHSQPVAPSAGCTFKNPQCQAAGALIDQLGLKGHRIGAAEVSTVHANFIVNTGGATARNILDLIDYIKQRVFEQSGVELETEVKVIGDRDLSF